MLPSVPRSQVRRATLDLSYLQVAWLARARRHAAPRTVRAGCLIRSRRRRGAAAATAVRAAPLAAGAALDVAPSTPTISGTRDGHASVTATRHGAVSEKTATGAASAIGVVSGTGAATAGGERGIMILAVILASDGTDDIAS